MSHTKRFRMPRRAAEQFTQSKFVQRDEFCNVLLGYRKIVRSDVPAKQLRGLIDVATGTRFLIEEEKLLQM